MIAKSLIAIEQSMVFSISDSMLIRAKQLRRSFDIVERCTFLISFSLEVDLSPVQLVTIILRKIRRALSMLGKDNSR